MAKPSLDFSAELPGEIEGWKKSAEAEIFTPKTLYNYINGGAELYNSYCFRSLTALRYLDAGGAEIRVDIFDMGHSYNAYGVFSHGRESVSDEFGQGSEYASGLLTFFKGQYYVSLLAYPVNADKKKVLFQLARRIDELVPVPGALPRVVSLLPREHLLGASVRFFYHPSWLNSYFHVAHDNVLQLNSKAQAVLAKYKHPAGYAYLLLVLYPDAHKAAAASKSFSAHYLRDAKGGRKKLGDGQWAGIKRSGRLLISVLRAPKSSIVDQMIASIAAGSQ
jgi:hypothetical protein